jgi:hypothetical protein
MAIATTAPREFEQRAHVSRLVRGVESERVSGVASPSGSGRGHRRV